MNIRLMKIWSMVDMRQNSMMVRGTRRMTESHGLRRRYPLCAHCLL